MGYERFDRLCKKFGTTAFQVAKETGVTTATLSSWKKGRYTPKADKLQKLADYFGVPLTYFTAPDDVEESEHQTEYYIDTETAALAQKLMTDPNYRILFDAAQDSRPEDMLMVADLLRRFKEERR